MKKQHRDKLKAVKKCNGKCPSKMTKGEKTKCQLLEKELGKAGKGQKIKTKCGEKLEKFNIKEPKAPKDDPECEQPCNKYSKEHAEKCQAKRLEAAVKKEEEAAKKAEDKEKEEKKEDKKEDKKKEEEKKKEPESQASVEARMIQILKSTKEHMESVSKSLKDQAETARLLAKVRDHSEVKKTEDEIKKLKTEITKKPKEAMLDVNVDGVHIGHMVLQSGGNYDLNLKSDEIKSTVDSAPPKKTSDDKVNLIDDGKKIIDANKNPAAAEKKDEKKDDNDILDAVKKTISDSLRSFAQTYASSNTMMLAQTESELFEADDEKSEKPNFRKYPHLIKTANQDADGDDDDDDDDDEDGEDGDGDGDGDSDGDGDGDDDDDDDDDDDEEPENPNADLMRAKLSDA